MLCYVQSPDIHAFARIVLKLLCAAGDDGPKLSGTPEPDRGYPEAAATSFPEFKPEHYIDAMKTPPT